jgi:hypothetical protein
MERNSYWSSITESHYIGSLVDFIDCYWFLADHIHAQSHGTNDIDVMRPANGRHNDKIRFRLVDHLVKFYAWKVGSRGNPLASTSLFA